VTLGPNASGTFCNRVAQPHKVSSDNTSLWLQGLHGETLVFPCAHAEGRFGFADTEKWRTALHYPPGQNPDGSVEGIAGITDTEGRVLGLMNHPERAQHRSQNLILFENGVRAVRG
jgi:phosphoribosylformylglycinamidine synthase